MRDEGTRILDDMIRVCKEVRPLLYDTGSIVGKYQRTDFEDVFKAIGELYHTLVCFHIPTRYLNIDVEYPVVKITLDYRAIKILCPVYGEEEDEGEHNETQRFLKIRSRQL